MFAGQRRNLLIGSSVVLVAVAIYLWFFGWTTVFSIEAHQLGKQYPIVYKVPAPLPDSSISSSTTQKFSTGQFELEVPWTDMVEVKTKAPANWLVLNSPAGIGLLVTVGKPNELVKMLNVPGHEAEVEALFGSEVLESDYSLAQYMLETTPDRVRPFARKKEDVSRMMMLTLKSITHPKPAASGIFRLQTPEFRGFQYGDPSKSPVWVNLYAQDAKVELIFSTKNGLVISQPEINRVLQSVHKKAN